MANSGDTKLPEWPERATVNLANMLQHALEHDGPQQDWDQVTTKLLTMTAKAKALRQVIGNSAVADRLFSSGQAFALADPKTIQQLLAMMESAAADASRIKRRDGLSPKRLCALMAGTIAELGTGKWPSKKSPNAQVICDALWSMASGNARQLATMDPSENSSWWRHLEWASKNRHHHVRLAILRLITDALEPDATKFWQRSNRPAIDTRQMPLRPGQRPVKT